MAHQRPIAIYYEHPQWFRPLFHELDRRETPYVRIDAGQHRFTPGEGPRNGSRPALLFNRMSPSAWKRGRRSAIFYTHDYLAHLERENVHVFNGAASYRFETSKALQLSLLSQARLPSPRTRIVNHPSLLPEAAEGLRFPLIVKPNIGGSGAGIRRFDTFLSLVEASEDPSLARQRRRNAAAAGVPPAAQSQHRARGDAGASLPLRNPRPPRRRRGLRSLPRRRLPDDRRPRADVVRLPGRRA